jgi:hypothetical protein
VLLSLKPIKGSPAIKQSLWGKTKSAIKKHKLLPSSIFCKGLGNRVWTNVFRVEDDFEFKTGISK